MRIIKIFILLFIIFSLYTCKEVKPEIILYSESIYRRAPYLNNLILSELNNEGRTLNCHLIQPNFEYFDNIAFQQNLKYLFQGMSTVKFSTIDKIKIFVSIPKRDDSSKVLYNEYSFKEFRSLLSDYQYKEFKDQFNKLFVINEEYREREIFNDLNYLSGEFLNLKANEKIHDMGFDFTVIIKDLILNCDNQNLSDTISRTIIGFLKEQNPEYPVVYNELHEYFDELCKK